MVAILRALYDLMPSNFEQNYLYYGLNVGWYPLPILCQSQADQRDPSVTMTVYMYVYDSIVHVLVSYSGPDAIVGALC